MTNTRKATLDDGMNPELLLGAYYDGMLQIPSIEAPKHIFIPKEITPYSNRKYDQTPEQNAIGFYEMDENFSEILINPDDTLNELRMFGAFITPDCSLYRNGPLAAQITNLYRNRVIGYRAQRKGLNVIVQVRWGNEYTYTTKYFPEKIAFLGAPKNSLIAIGPYGCIKTKDDKYHFQAGLESMLIELTPTDVLVYGAMPNNIFGCYTRVTRFHQYDDWLTRIKGGKR